MEYYLDSDHQFNVDNFCAAPFLHLQEEAGEVDPCFENRNFEKCREHNDDDDGAVCHFGSDNGHEFNHINDVHDKKGGDDDNYREEEEGGEGRGGGEEEEINRWTQYLF
ncbi:hypothetical protein ElyMa_004088100 [Elysia marginata]|uniref:Uncharacterized protein n=1 Tax=Elysia marginata TaxID=1093978 RepID=A0AAV4GAK7_9GAST|nr:hypothetical protein ElyMa_004088100 [Elysia marginata]